MPAESDPADDVIIALTGVLDQTLRALGDAGEPVAANRFAARAWSSLRSTHPEHAERVNRTMHYLARREAELDASRPQSQSPASQSPASEAPARRQPCP